MLDKYRSCFAEAFEIEPGSADVLEYQSIDNWDSVGHMSLMSLLEEKFDIVLDMDDIIDFASFKKGIEILSKYGVNIE